jgi:hypothetical protein
VDRGLPSLDLELLAALLGDLNPNVSLCQEIAEDPRCIAARVTASGGCELFIMRDGEANVLPIERFVDVEVFFRELVKRYLADVTTLPRAA